MVSAGRRVIRRACGRPGRQNVCQRAIIQRINAFARQRELVLAPVELARFVHHCIVTHPRSSTAVQVRWTGTPDQAVVLADELLLEHVAHNLLANALAWSARGTAGPACVQVAVATCIQAQGPMAMLSVADNGPGVPPESRDHIFNAFFSTHEGGMGMGLLDAAVVFAELGRHLAPGPLFDSAIMSAGAIAGPLVGGALIPVFGFPLLYLIDTICLLATLFFKYMPELDWTLGYPYVLALMLASALGPMWYFRKRGWLK